MKNIIIGVFGAAITLLAPAGPALADEPYVGEIRNFGFDFCPRTWASANGALLAVSSHDALFSLLGTLYGGDGRTTFALPDLRGRVPMHQGNGPGLSSRNTGQKFGTNYVSPTITNLANHTHALAGTVSPKMVASIDVPISPDPSDAYLGTFASQPAYTATMPGNPVAMGANSVIVDTTKVVIANTGEGRSVNNMAPFLVTNYCIALFGVYPSRN